jgi:G:T/U-mismatch repair DNA glycosylase
MTQHETHPWNCFAPPGSSILFVGTFPPVKSRWSYDFFYPNKANFFWRIIAAIAQKELQFFTGEEAVMERKSLLSDLHIAITDMGQHIVRTNNSSLDENIAVVTYMPILDILKQHPDIRKIVFTSSSGPVSAARWFVQYLKMNGITYRFPAGTKPLHSELLIEGRKISMAIVSSPSPRAANRYSFDTMVQMYANEINQA